MKNGIIIVAVVLLIGIGGWWFIGQSKKAEAPVVSDNTLNLETEDDLPMVDNQEEKGKGSLKSLLGLNKTQNCSFVVRAEDVVQEGNAFYEGGKARIDTMITMGGDEPIASYIIMDNDNDVMYMWSNMQEGGKKGMKMSISAQEELAKSAPQGSEEQEQNFDPNMDVDYNCKPWSVDRSVFVPPADVEFTDMSEMMEMMKSFEGMEMPEMMQ